MEFNVKKVKNFLSNNAITVMLVILVIFVGFTKKGFFGGPNISNIASNVTPRLIIALGISGCLIIKGTDLSAGRAVGLGGVIACTLLQRPDYTDKFFPNLPDVPVFAVLLLVIVITGIFGLLNGLIISIFKVPAFLTTLGTQTIVYGINLVYSGADPIGGLKTSFTDLATKPIFKFNFFGTGYFTFKWLYVFGIVIFILFWFLYNKTRYGKYMYAIGGNENAAEVSGVNVTKSRILIHTLAGAMYGLAGFLLAAKSGGASVNLGLGYELEAIASCTIGGVSTNGGIGKVSGVLLGVLVYELLKTSMQFLQIDTSYQYIVQGLVIVVAVALDIRKYIVKK